MEASPVRAGEADTVDVVTEVVEGRSRLFVLPVGTLFPPLGQSLEPQKAAPIQEVTNTSNRRLTLGIQLPRLLPQFHHHFATGHAQAKTKPEPPNTYVGEYCKNFSISTR